MKNTVHHDTEAGYFGYRNISVYSYGHSPAISWGISLLP